MPKNTVPAAGEAMPISRRKALGLMAAVSVPPTMAVAASPAIETENPTQKAGRLGGELAETLNEYCEGKFMAMIWPTSVKPQFAVGFRIIDLPGIHDPLLEAIEAFQDGNRRFCGMPDFATDEEQDVAIAATYGPPMEVLKVWDQPARTRAGAIAALKTVQEECLIVGDIGEAMVSAVLAYLEGIA